MKGTPPENMGGGANQPGSASRQSEALPEQVNGCVQGFPVSEHRLNKGREV